MSVDALGTETDTSATSAVPLCVDLDGTLVSTDLLYEQLFSLARAHFLCLFLLPVWLLQGKAHLKAQLARRIDLRAAVVPFNESVVDFVNQAHEQGRHTVLVTGSHQSVAEAVAAQVELFDEVQGTHETLNLTARRKRDWLVMRFGEQGFDYIGNEADDLSVWPAARRALAVSTPGGIATKARAAGIEFDTVFEREPPGPRDFLSLLRVHQWSKNLLVAVPFLLDHRLGDAEAMVYTLLAFAGLCALTSMTYILNDLLDLQSDRQNRTKSLRVLASGRLSAQVALMTMGVLALVVLALSRVLPGAFNTCLVLYLLLTLLYSFFLKRRAIADVLVIATLLTTRVLAGTYAIDAELSFWLLAFSMFLFYSLAQAKRVAELLNLQAEGRLATIGRDYQVADIPVLRVSGLASGYLSVLVVALYIDSDKVKTLYHLPEMLWFVCPMLLYIIGRVWLKTSRGLMHEDPIVFALRDAVSLFCVVLMGVILTVATIL